MSAFHVMQECIQRGVLLSLDNGRLKISAEYVDDDLLERIKIDRDQIVEILAHESEISSHSTTAISDFPLSCVSQEELQFLEVNYPLIQKLYVATPMQQGLIFHGLLSNNGSFYTNQIYCDLVGELDVDAFIDAWKYIVERHDVFRTCFVSLETRQAHQLVLSHVDLPVAIDDWRDFSEQERVSKLLEFRKQDKAKGFVFEKAPLLRITLIRLADNEYHFLWTHHHAVLDGWCLPTILSELMQSYSVLLEGGDNLLDEPFQYDSYIDWLSKFDDASALKFWRNNLQGITKQTSLFGDAIDINHEEQAFEWFYLDIDRKIHKNLDQLAKRLNCTISVLVQGAWAILLHRYSGESSVVFGSTFSGRPGDLPGVESMTGLFLNAVPIRCDFDKGLTVEQLLQRIHEGNIEREIYSYSGLPAIQSVSELPNGQALFESLIVVENYPLVEELNLEEKSSMSGIKFRSVGRDAETNYPVTLIIRSNNQLSVILKYQSNAIENDTALRLKVHLEALLRDLALGASGEKIEQLKLSTKHAQSADGSYPLSSIQKSIWRKLKPTAGKNLAHQFCIYTEVAKEIDCAALNTAVQFVIECESVLRLEFLLEENGNVKQKIRNERKFTIEEIEFSTEKEPIVSASNWIDTTRNEVLSPIGALPFHFALLKLGKERYCWYTQFHSLLVNEEGAFRIRRKIDEAYRLYCSENRLPTLIDDRQEHIAYLESDFEYRYSSQYVDDKKYWSTRLNDLVDITSSNNRQLTYDLRNTVRASLSLGCEVMEPLKGRANKSAIGLDKFMVAITILYLHKVKDQEIMSIVVKINNAIGQHLGNRPFNFASAFPVLSVANNNHSCGQFIAALSDYLDSSSHHGRFFDKGITKTFTENSAGSWSSDAEVCASFCSLGSSFQDVDDEFVIFSRLEDNLSIRIYISEETSACYINIDGNPDLLEQWEMELHRDRLSEFIHGFVSHIEAETKLDSLSLLTQSEGILLTEEFNTTQHPFPVDTCLQQLFERHATFTPGQLAVESGSEALSYKVLNEKSNQLARFLILKGAKPNMLVGVCMHRGIDMIVSLLAILKSGAAYLPLDPEYPEGRLDYMISDARPLLLLTHATLLGRISAEGIEIVAIDKQQDYINENSSENIPIESIGLTSCHPAYVIYTSGTTGNPKGVVVDHKNLANLITAVCRDYRLTPDDRFLQFSSISFDMSVEDIFGTLCNGCSLILRDDRWLESEQKFWSFCEELEVTLVNLPTSYWHQLVFSNCLEIPSTVRQVMVGGERISPNAVDLWRSYSKSNIRLINAYGPTETTVNAAISIDDNADFAKIIGRPFANTKIYILSSTLKLVPIGEVGELYIGGAGVARGYLNSVIQTVEKFVPNPFSDDSNEKVYRSGDLARWRIDGNLDYIGRIDDQIKIRGYRIEIKEIESQILKINEVGAVAVLMKEGSELEKYLVAYVVLRDRHNNLATEEAFSSSTAIQNKSYAEKFGSALRNNLPDYMCPRNFVFVDQMPLTVNGKIDKAKLIDIEEEISLKASYAAPIGEVEIKLSELWEQVLDCDHIGIHDDFFQLGGQSLLATRLVSMIRQAFEVEIPLRIIFKSPTIAGLAISLNELLDSNKLIENQVQLESSSQNTEEGVL